MADTTERRGELATELPSKYLPAVEYRDLPEPVPVTKIIGASVILLATAIGSGELIIWMPKGLRLTIPSVMVIACIP
jgi:hypothetical protein